MEPRKILYNQAVYLTDRHTLSKSRKKVVFSPFRPPDSKQRGEKNENKAF